MLKAHNRLVSAVVDPQANETTNEMIDVAPSPSQDVKSDTDTALHTWTFPRSQSTLFTPPSHNEAVHFQSHYQQFYRPPFPSAVQFEAYEHMGAQFTNTSTLVEPETPTTLAESARYADQLRMEQEAEAARAAYQELSQLQRFLDLSLTQPYSMYARN
jgi:hypothetical protein